MIYSIKPHVLWKFSFTVWSTLEFLICFKQARSHQSPKLSVRYLLLAKSAIYHPYCNNCSVEKVYAQDPIPFFSRIIWRYDYSKRSIRSTQPIPLLCEPMRCGCVTSPPYFAHRFMIFPVTCVIYDRVVVQFSFTAVIVCASFFLLNLFALNKLFVCTLCSVFLNNSCALHAFFS